MLPERIEARLFQVVSIEHVESVKRNQPLSIWVGNVDAGLADGAEIKAIGIYELHNQDAKKVLVTEILGREHLRKAA